MMCDNDYERSTCSFLSKPLCITHTYLGVHSMHVTLYTKFFILLLFQFCERLLCAGGVLI